MYPVSGILASIVAAAATYILSIREDSYADQVISGVSLFAGLAVYMSTEDKDAKHAGAAGFLASIVAWASTEFTVGKYSKLKGILPMFAPAGAILGVSELLRCEKKEEEE